MLIPKASHLVERAAQRLLSSGALDESASQLLLPTGTAATLPIVPPAEIAKDAVQDGSMPAPFQSRPAEPNEATNAEHPSPIQDDIRQPVSAVPPANPPVPAPGAGATVASTGKAQPPTPLSPDLIVTKAPPDGHSSSFPNGAPAIDPREPVARAPSGLAKPALAIDAASLERAGMVDWSRTRSRISEEFRLVQRQILRSAFGPEAEPGFSNLLMVTSARPGEGKSFMSMNMAGSIARQGDNHVLLIDADSKRDSICYGLGLAQARGLLDLVANPRLDPTPLIVRTPIERLSILPVGRERERTAELFSTKEMTRLIQNLGRRYADRLLILDAPPCLSTSDPAVLAQVVGQILFVVEASRTQRDEVEASLDLIQACPTITMVLNKQQISSRYTFGAYSSYYSS